MNRKTVTYLRVSTDKQEVEPQRAILANYCASKGITIDHEYCDIVSGSKESRQDLNAMLAACERGEIGRILAVRLDRVFRSLSGFLRMMEKLNKLNVALVCPSQNINTESETLEGKLMRNIFAIFAEFERGMIGQRTKEGLAVARANGAKIGRPSPVLVKNWPEVVAAWKSEMPSPGYAELARRLGGVSKSTAHRLAKK